MKEINLEVVNREKIGKSNSKNLRNDGKIPAIIYGDKKESNYIFLEYVIIKLSVFITKLTPENLYLEIQEIIPY